MSKLQQQMQELQQTPFDYLVFSGGGAKGAIYSGAYEGVTEAGIVKGVKAVAGSSAGAITAAFIAVGTPVTECARISRETNLKGLLGTEGVSVGPLQLGKDGTPLYELLDTTIRKSAYDFIRDKNYVELCETSRARIAQEQQNMESKRQDLLNQLAELEQSGSDTKEITEDIKGLNLQMHNLHTQAERVQFILDSGGKEFFELMDKCEQGGKILFKDLALLRLLDPERFKDLLVTAVRRDDGTLQIFSAENTPDVEIASACRASAAIPLVFQPVTINGSEYVDGGYIDNIPINYFPENTQSSYDIQKLDSFEEIEQAKKRGRTLALAFGSGMDASANIAIYSGKSFVSPSVIYQFLVDVLYKMLAGVGGTFKHTETDKVTMETLRENALNAVTLDTQGISTLDFDDAQKYSDYLHVKGYQQAREYLDNHQVGKEVDSTFEQQKFCLAVYEEYNHEALHKSFWRKTWESFSPAPKDTQEKQKKTWVERDDIKNHEEKAEILLQCATAKCWCGKDKKTGLKEYVVFAASARNKELKTDTKAMESLMKTLNSPTTSSVVKKDFMDLLGIDKKQDKRFDEKKAPAQNVAEFKFTKEDFSRFLSQNKHAAFQPNALITNLGQPVMVR